MTVPRSDMPPLEALPLDVLRRRSSTKWRSYGHDVIPLFVAETDFALAESITRVLTDAISIGDTGYTPPRPGIAETFVSFAARRFDWAVDAGRVRWTADVMMGVVELLRATTRPGDRVIITPPVYPPFFDTVEEAGAVAASVPLIDTGEGWELDLAAIEATFRDGARGILLCNPHNPTGTVHSRASLTALAEIAARYEAVVISDEIHGPLVHDPAAFTPFLAASPVAEQVGFVVTSASKAFNLAGLKCAVMVAGGERHADVLRALPAEVEWRTGLFGALANNAAFGGEADGWLDGLLRRLDLNRHLLADLLAEHLPLAAYRVPDAGFLAWVDVSAYGWGDDPAGTIRRDAKVAVNPGPSFGPFGAGHIRINFGCGPEVLTEAIARIGALVAARV